MLSKNRIKYINALKIKKFRQAYDAFLVEGTKSVIELLNSDFEIELLLATDEFQQKYSSILSKHKSKIETATLNELQGVGTFQTNDSCLAVAKIKPNEILVRSKGEYIIILDNVRDPGNLGAIIRIADWYGVKKIICSPDTTDWYNPKVIAASKGSFTRVKSYYTNLKGYLENYGKDDFVGGAFLDGGSIYNYDFNPNGGCIVMGNESNGISDEVGEFVTDRLTIPRIGDAESLNVGIATAVIMDNLRRILPIS